jgi:hypothetical protein
MAMGNLVKLWQASPFSSVLVYACPKEYYPTFVSGMKAFIQAVHNKKMDLERQLM